MITITRVKEAVSEFIKVLRFGRSDIRTARQSAPAGIDSLPVKDAVAVHIETSNMEDSVVIGYLKNSQVDPGEMKLYATDSSGGKAFEVYIKGDGTIEIGGNSDNLVGFSDLKSGFDELRGDLNSLISAYNTHTHGTGVVPETLGVPSVASVAGSKKDDLRCM